MYLRLFGSTEKPQRRPCWRYIVIGFLLIFLGSIAKLIVDVPYQSALHGSEGVISLRFVEKIAGETIGNILIIIGIWYTIPVIATFGQKTQDIKEYNGELYRTLARTLPQSAVLLFDHHLRYIVAEGSVLARYGYTKESIEGKTIYEALPIGNVADLEPHYWAALTGSEYTTEHIAGNDTYLLHILPVKNDQEQIFAGMMLIQDITEDRQAEAALRESDERLNLVIASAPIFLFTLDEKGAFTFLEGKGLDVLQLKPVDNLGRSVFDVYRDDPQILRNRRRALTGEAFTSIETVADYVFETRYSPLRDEHGSVWSVIGVATDITEQQQAKEELRLQRDFALQVMNTMGQGLVVTDIDRRFEFVNPTYAHMLGYAPDDLIGTSFLDMVLPEDRARLSQVFAQLDGHAVTIDEIRLQCADNRTISVLMNDVLRWRDAEVVGVISVITDLTERKQIEEERALSRDQALEASRLKSEFLATMSHEIRTPMNAIIGMTELLIDTVLAPSQREFVSVIQESGQALLDIIDDILDFSKIEAGKLVLDLIDFHPSQVVEGSAELLASKARVKGLALLTFVDPRIPQVVYGDPGRLRQVLLNLISNAVKFTHQGEVVIRAVLVGQTATDVTIRFSVQDTGIGISEATRKRLFQPFTQADGSTTRTYGGTGLGLAISKRLTELMAGDIGVESVEGQGSTFWFTANFQHIGAAPIETNLRGLQVLIVDDSQTQQDIIQSYAFSWGIRTSGAANGGEALTILRRAASMNDPYSLVIIDASLPDMDGQTLARAIQRDTMIAQTKLIFLTTMKDWNIADQSVAVEFAAYITKPVKQSHLFNVITSLVEQAADRPVKKVTNDGSSCHVCVQPAIQHADILILLVEDYPANQLLALRQLEKLGYAAHAVSNGREAVEAMTRNANAYNLILMDCQTPEMDGFEATRAIRSIERTTGQHIPIIAMTANAMRGDREACIAAGMDDYISKPVVWETLRDVLARWLPLHPNDEALVDHDPGHTHDDALLDSVILDSLRELQDAGEPNFLSDLVDIYMQESPIFLEMMRAAIDQGDAKTLCQAVHTFKGSSANIGARTVADLCKQLEAVSRSGITIGAVELFEQIEREYERVKPALEAEGAVCKSSSA